MDEVIPPFEQAECEDKEYLRLKKELVIYLKKNHASKLLRLSTIATALHTTPETLKRYGLVVLICRAQESWRATNIYLYLPGEQRPRRKRGYQPPLVEEKRTFGDCIQALRSQRGWTQSELATRLGCTPGMVNALERNAMVPSSPLMERLATVLEVSLTELEQMCGGGFNERKLRQIAAMYPSVGRLIRTLLGQPLTEDLLARVDALRVQIEEFTS
jgi:transcriptional regulator with XRE-family HTH domain